LPSWRARRSTRLTAAACSIRLALSCRTFGLPINAGGTVLPPCHLNFVGASPEQVAAATVALDPEDIGDRCSSVWPRSNLRPATPSSPPLSLPPFENFASQAVVFSTEGGNASPGGEECRCTVHVRTA
jgi:hypothetical protein